MKRILVVYYSQSGQLKEIIDSLLQPIEGVVVDYLAIDTIEGFLFLGQMKLFLGLFLSRFCKLHSLCNLLNCLPIITIW